MFDAATGETPLAGQTIFLDLNDNFHLDASEPFQVSGADGRYEFANVVAGSYSVRQVDSLKYEPTSPAHAEPSIRVVDLATHLTYDPVRDKLYASVGTTVGVIDQGTGEISASIELGTSPGLMVVSDNGEVMYVVINQGKEVLAVNLVTLTKGASFTLGNNRSVNEMQVMPGTTNILAISWYGGSSNPSEVAIFENGIQRPNTQVGARMAFSEDGSILYTDVGTSFVTLGVNSEGLVLLSKVEGVINTIPHDFKLANGRIYMSGGRVLDAQSGAIVGTLPMSPYTVQLEVDPDNGLLYVSGSMYGYLSDVIQAFDLQTLRQVGAFELPRNMGQATQLIRTGDGQLAVNVCWNQLVFVDWQPRIASHEVEVADGQTVSLDLGSEPREVPGTIQGQVFLDVNESRSVTKGEPGLVGQTVFLDANANGLLDTGERSTLTDSAGKYVFDGLPPGSYTVAVVAAPGWEITSPSPQEFRVRRLPFGTGDQLYDAPRDKIYATVDSSFEAVGNSLVVIDPQTGAIEKSIELGGESSQLAMSRDGKALYVVLNGLNSISRIDLATLTKELTFSLGVDPLDGLNRVIDLEVLGGGAETIAVLRSDDMLAIYDNGVLRPGSLYYAYDVRGLTSDSNTLYGESYGKLLRFSVTAAGITLVSTGPKTPLSSDLLYHEGIIYSGEKKFDPQTGALIGAAPVSDPESWDVPGAIAFVSYGNELTAFDLNTSEFVRSLALEQINGPREPIYAGNSTLTFSDGKLTYLVDWNPRQPAKVREHNVVVVAGQAITDLNFGEFNPAVGSVPIAVPDSFRIAQPVANTIAAPGVLANDLDDNPASLQAILVDGPTKGTVVLHADGSFLYTPGATFGGLDSFTYRTFNGQGLSEVKQVSIAEALPGGPLALNDSYTIIEDTPFGLPAPGVLANDTGAAGRPSIATLVTGPSNGQFQFNANGSFAYTPNQDFTGTDRFTYRAEDENGISRLSTVTLMVLPRNDAPTGIDDSYTTPQNTALVVAARGVLINDLDPDTTTLTALLVAPPAHGTVVLAADGSFTYFPDTDYSGPDSFTYRPKDFQLTSANPTTVALTVMPVAGTPTALGETYTLAEDTVLSIPAGEILTNDSDPNGLALTAVLGATVQHGKLTFSADGKFTYTPARNYSGPDQFTYRANSSAGNSGLATVSLLVTPVNDPPTVGDDSFRGLQGQTLSVAAPGVLKSESDADKDALQAVWVDGPANGTLTLRPDGSFEYVPYEGFFGIDRFYYRTTDGTTESRIVKVDLDIESLSQIPEAVNDFIDIPEDSSPSWIVPLGNDKDTNDINTRLTLTLESQPQHGTITVDSNGRLHYQPAPNYNGPDSFTYRASDGLATSNLATVTLNVLPFNDLPVAKPDSYSAVEDSQLVIGPAGVLANDIDDTNALTVKPLLAPAHGQLELQADGSFRYVPDEDFSGTDSFVYGVFDRPSVSGVLYFTNKEYNSSKTNLFAIDLATGNQQLIQTFNGWGSVEYLPDGRLLMLTDKGLLEVDTEAGQFQPIADDESPATGGSGLAYNPANGKLYAFADTSNEDSLMTVDPNTGKRTVVGSLTVPMPEVQLGYWRFESLVASNDGWLYSKLVRQNGPDYLLRIDPATAEVTIVGPTGMNDSGPIEFDPSSKTLYMATKYTLFALDMQSGAATPLKPPAGGTFYLNAESLTIPTTGPQSRATVTIQVAPVNDAPSFLKGDDVHTTDEAGPTRIDNWATNIFAEGTTASAQGLSFTVTTDAAGLFLTPPQITPGGSLLFTPKPGASGMARVTVSLWDDGGTANGGIDHSEKQTFTIDISKKRVWHNTTVPQDVTGDNGEVSADDALAIINYINAAKSDTVPTDGQGGGPYYDVTGDGYIAADDVVTVINYINARPNSEGEAAVLDQTTADNLSSDLISLLAFDITEQAVRRRRLQ